MHGVWDKKACDTGMEREMTAGKNGRYGAKAWPGMRQIPQISMDNALAMHSRYSILQYTATQPFFDSTVRQHSHFHSGRLGHRDMACVEGEVVLWFQLSISLWLSIGLSGA